MYYYIYVYIYCNIYTTKLYMYTHIEIWMNNFNVCVFRFSDIIQLDEAKRLLIEAVQLPLRFPFLFTGILRPWRG